MRDRCIYLNQIRANFTVCCKYPTMVLWRWKYSACVDECQKKQANDDCCLMVCNYRSFGAIPQANETTNNATHDSTSALAYSFLLSVGNDTQWTGVVDESLSYCSSIVIKQALFDTCGFPFHLFEIIDCSYNEIYFRCPFWNPFNLKACDYTREYIDLCFRYKD